MEENEFKMVEELADRGFDVGLECSNGQIRLKIGRMHQVVSDTGLTTLPALR